jgi:rhodanese-related sulfurtransferase
MVRAAVGSRAAAAVDPELPVVVTAATRHDARAMARQLEAVGFRRIVGILLGGIDAWRTAGLPLDRIESIQIAELAERIRRHEVVVLDVRDPDEWAGGHVPGSLHVPYQELRDHPPNLNGKPVAVVCGAGNRAGLAASVLRRDGIEHVIHVAGGGVTDLVHHDITLTEEDDRT